MLVLDPRSHYFCILAICIVPCYSFFFFKNYLIRPKFLTLPLDVLAFARSFGCLISLYCVSRIECRVSADATNRGRCDRFSRIFNRLIPCRPGREERFDESIIYDPCEDHRVNLLDYRMVKRIFMF